MVLKNLQPCFSFLNGTKWLCIKYKDLLTHHNYALVWQSCIYSARKAATAPVVAGTEGGGRGEGTSLELPAIFKNLLETIHT